MWILLPCLIVWGIASIFYEPEEENRAKVLMGIACFVVIAFIITSSRDGEQIDPADLGGKLTIYLLAAFIATIVKDARSGKAD